MIVTGIKNNKLFKLFLPDRVEGNYVLKDNTGEMLGNIIAENNNWIIYPNEGYTLSYNNVEVEKNIVEDYSQFVIKNKIDASATIIIASPTVETNMIEIKPLKTKLTIGSNPENDITYGSPLVNAHHATLSIDKGRWYIECTEKSYVFVDDKLAKRKRLNHGDVVFIYGLKLVCLCDFLVLMNTAEFNALKAKDGVFEPRSPITQQVKEEAFKLESEAEVFSPNEQYMRSPRFKTSVTHETIKLSAPPQSNVLQIQPTILTIGPQLTMTLTSMMSIFTTVTSISSGNATFASAMPSIIMTLIMIISSFLWPSLTRKWQKRETRKKEIKRVRTFRNYLAKKDKEITNIIAKQKQVLLENNISLEQCQQIIYQRKRNLWERTLEDDDYLTVRIGTGFVKPDITISYEEEDFSIEDDVLKDELKELIKKYDYVEEVPLNVSMLENRILAVIGNFGILQSFFESIMLQLMTFHLYSELKIVVFTNEARAKDWDFIKFLPHCWDNPREQRFIAATIDEKKKVASYLESVIKEREEKTTTPGQDEKKQKKPKEIDETAYKQFNCYYLIITDDITSCRNLELFNKVLNMKDNLGFSMIIKNDRIANLPNQCSTFINVTEDVSGMFKNDLSEQNQKQFKADLNKTISVEDCVRQVANIYVQIPKEKYELPKSIGFMEMYGVGNVEQFNSADRWSSNNPVVSLSVPVGIDQNGELFNMDIHEKAYGPHGLVAGTTGSGKSEWIITYILSLCVNFSPLEVQFVLIDYKGGGLAGSFENKETGISLPHLIGTITNLDKSEIRRSLASLEAESKRRQRMFNEAREKLNDSSMNIYKYQQYYRKGMLEEPLSHLFIISDEFAELKAQEPEFLDQLVSIARIGRSLGIHLILATQKPAGVVDEQMWSNSRFKVCLRVQDKQDSQDMLKCDDAAYLKQTGAFYFQVGLNEFFGLGQSAYAGLKYKPTNIIKKKIDTSLDVINRVGEVINNVDYIEADSSDSTQAHGEELLNIIVYLSELSKKQGLSPRKLWLDSIPETIFVDSLKTKYGFTREPFNICPIFGEYDDPHKQLQNILRESLNYSNVYIGGISGSGKEKLLQSIIYSTITNYTPQEVGFYICDFGAETLGMFEDAPHVGEVIYGKDKVKIENLQRFLKKEMSARRKRYREFGGNFESYTKYSPNKDHLIVVVINELSFLKENYQDIFDEFENIIVDSAKYGIIFVETAVDLMTHKNKVYSSFQNQFMLKFNQGEYEMALGSAAKGINPKDLKGRGLFLRDGSVYEFQVSSICDEEKLQQAVKFVCQKLKQSYNVSIPPIPSIPHTINMDVIYKSKINVNSVCVGYSQAMVEPYYMDFQKNQGTLILGGKKQHIRNYCKVLNQQLDIVAEQGTKVYLFDAEDIFKMEHYKSITYVNTTEIVNTINNLLIYINNEAEKYDALEDKSSYKVDKRSLIVFYCASEMFSMCGNQITDMFETAFDKARELGLFDFVVIDTLNDYKDIQRNKGLLHMFMDANGVLISNIQDTQMNIDITVKDIKLKEGIMDREGYIVERGKAKLSQMLQFEGDDIEEEE